MRKKTVLPIIRSWRKILLILNIQNVSIRENAFSKSVFMELYTSELAATQTELKIAHCHWRRFKILYPSVIPESFLDTQDGLPHHSSLPVTLRHCCSATSCPSASYFPFRVSRKEDSWRLCSTLWPGWEKKHNCWWSQYWSVAGGDSYLWGITWRKKWPQAQNCKVYKIIWSSSLRAWSYLTLMSPLGEKVYISKC